MPDAWELANNTSPTMPDAHLDLDGDTFSNRLEYLYQSIASNADSIPEIELGIKRAVRVDVSTIEGVTYQIQSSLTPDGPWSDRGTAFDGDGNDHSFYFDAESDSEIFKATVRDTGFWNYQVTPFYHAIAPSETACFGCVLASHARQSLLPENHDRNRPASNTRYSR